MKLHLILGHGHGIAMPLQPFHLVQTQQDLVEVASMNLSVLQSYDRGLGAIAHSLQTQTCRSLSWIEAWSYHGSSEILREVC